MPTLAIIALGVLALVVVGGVLLWRGPLGDRIWVSFMVRHTDPGKRSLGAFMLATRCQGKANEIRRLLTDPEPEVRTMALMYLGPRIADEPEILELLIERLRSGALDEVTAVATALEEAGPAAVSAAPALIQRGVELEREAATLPDEWPDEATRQRALAISTPHQMTSQALGPIAAGNPEVAQMLLDLWAGDTDERAFALAGLLSVVRATGDHRSPDGATAERRARDIASALALDRNALVHRLATALDPDNEREALLMVLLLEELGPRLPEARAALLTALASEEVGDTAARALALFGEDARDELETRSRDDDPSVRKHALEALGDMLDNSDETVDATTEHGLQEPGGAGRNLDQSSPLLAALADPAQEVRAQAAWSLGDVKEPTEEIVWALAERLREDPHPRVRWAAVQALGRLGPAAGAASAELIASFEDPCWVVRWMGTYSVAAVGPGLIEGIERAAKGESVPSRAGAVRVAATMLESQLVQLNSGERERLELIATNHHTEAELLALLHAVERGDLMLTSDQEPSEVYCGDCYYESNDGWQLVVFNDCGQWDYLHGVQSPDGRVTLHGEIDRSMGQVEFYDPNPEISWRAWGIRPPEANDGSRWLDGRRHILPWDEPAPTSNDS